MAKKMTKAQLIHELSARLNISKTAVKEFLATLATIAGEELLAGKDFSIPDVAKLKVAKKSATKERNGINPFTKQPMKIAAKPESKKVKAYAAKSLKKVVIG